MHILVLIRSSFAIYPHNGFQSEPEPDKKQKPENIRKNKKIGPKKRTPKGRKLNFESDKKQKIPEN